MERRPNETSIAGGLVPIVVVAREESLGEIRKFRCYAKNQVASRGSILTKFQHATIAGGFLPYMRLKIRFGKRFRVPLEKRLIGKSEF